MGLIFFTYFCVILLLVDSSYLSFHQSNRINVLLNKITVPATLVALCIALSVHLTFYGKPQYNPLYQHVHFSLWYLLLIIFLIWPLLSPN